MSQTDQRLYPLGCDTPNCPYCGVGVKTMRGFRDCPSCGGSIHASRRPVDEKHVLLTDQQRLVVEEQWAIKRGHHDRWMLERLRYEAQASRLSETLGCEPTEREIRASLLREEQSEHKASGKWGLYCNCLQQIAELAWEARDMAEVIALQAEVNYIDRCGPKNGYSGGNGFDASLALRPEHGPACRFIEACIESEVSREEAEARFLAAAERVKAELKTRVDPRTCWRELVAFSEKHYTWA